MTRGLNSSRRMWGPGQRMVYAGGSPPPDQLLGAALTAWLRVANATSGVNGISSVPDVLNTNPAVQSVDARKPVIENSANGLPCMRFAINDVLVWPITAQSSASSQAGWGFWMKLDTLAASVRAIRVTPTTGGASGIKLGFSITNTGAMSGVASSSGTNFKQPTSATGLVTLAWQFFTVEYDKDGATDADKVVITLGGVPLAGTFTGSDVLGVLFAATGNIFIGNSINDVTAQNPLNGLIGPNIYAFGAKMPGATTGLLTTTARAALMAYEQPT